MHVMPTGPPQCAPLVSKIKKSIVDEVQLRTVFLGALISVA